MELRGQCVLPSNAPALPSPPSAGSSKRDDRCVLQEGSANGRHAAHHTLTPSPESLNASPWEPTQPSSPSETVARHVGSAGGYYQSQLGTGLGTPMSGERSEAEIEQETERLMQLLQRSEAYMSYRENQPTRGSRNSRGQVWPWPLERAFFKALVRWPPVGRTQQMFGGKPQGRNELIALSIKRETGISRDRKQISSHIQVLKPKLADQPALLACFSKRPPSGKGQKHRQRQLSAAQQRSQHLSQLRQRQALRHARYNRHGRSHPNYCTGNGPLPSSIASQSGLESTLNEVTATPFAVSDFAMFVLVNKSQRIHDFITLSQAARSPDLYITDTSRWNKQYAEFNFLPVSKLQDKRCVLVCDAAVKIMADSRPRENANISIDFDLQTACDLSVYTGGLSCRTQFFDNGSVAEQPVQWDGQWAQETRTDCEYGRLTDRDAGDGHGVLRVKFGSKFWAHRMMKMGDRLRTASCAEDESEKQRLEKSVREELMGLTARQEIYGRREAREDSEECFLTILWRFRQTRGSDGQGLMTWRVVEFAEDEEEEDEDEEMKTEDVDNKSIELLPHVNNGHAEQVGPIYHHPSTLPVASELEYHQMHSEPVHDHYHDQYTHDQVPPPAIDIDTLNNIYFENLAPADSYSNPASACLTDYSQTQSLPSLTHTQETITSHGHSQHTSFADNANDLDFDGGHITISGCLEPAIMHHHLGSGASATAYDGYSGRQTQGLSGVSSTAGLEHAAQHQQANHHHHHHHHDEHAGFANYAELGDLTGLGVGSGADGAVDLAPEECYATKPSWHHTGLIHTLEGVAEQYAHFDQHQQPGPQDLSPTRLHHAAALSHPQHSPFHHSQVSSLEQDDDVVGHGVLARHHHHDGQLSAHSQPRPTMWRLQSPYEGSLTPPAPRMCAGARRNSHVDMGVGIGAVQPSTHTSGLGIVDLTSSNQVEVSGGFWCPAGMGEDDEGYD